MQRLTLIGLRASGKTTAGRQAAIRCGWPFTDADHALAERLGMSAGTYLSQYGEPAFRDAETAILEELLAGDSPLVLATGGGAVLRPANRDLLRRRGGVIAYLHATPEVLMARLSRDAGDRPSLTGLGVSAEVPRLYALRDPLYRELAASVIDATTGTAAVVGALHRLAIDQATS